MTDYKVHLRMEPSTQTTHRNPRSKLTCLWPLGQANPIKTQSVPAGLDRVTPVLQNNNFFNVAFRSENESLLFIQCCDEF